MTTHKPIPCTFNKNGKTYEQLHRSEQLALYRHALPTGHVTGYEVHRIQRHEGRTIGDVQLPPAEYLPGDEDFGTKAWAYKTLSAATAKLEQQETILATPIAAE